MSMKLCFLFRLDESLKTKERFRISYSCSNKECGDSCWKDDNFCSICGAEVEEKKELIQMEYPDVSDFCDTYLDGSEIVRSNLDGEGIPENIWSYNFSLPKEMKHYVPSEYDSFFNVSAVDLEKGLEEFNNIPEVKNVITKFEEVYGKGMMTTFYGFIESYC